MSAISVSEAVSHDKGCDCDRLHVDSYEMEEVMLPSTNNEDARKAIRVVVHGRNFIACAQSLVVLIGNRPLKYLRISPDERSVEGILLEEPEAGATINVYLGDQDATKHPVTLDLSIIRRIAL